MQRMDSTVAMSQTPPKQANVTVPMPGNLLRRVLIGVAVALPATALVLGAGLFVSRAGEWWIAFAPATVIAFVSAALSLIPIGIAGRFSKPETLMLMFIGGGVVRMVASLGLGLLAVHAGGFPQTPTLLLIVLYYFVVLAVEAGVLARLLWSMPTPTPTEDPSQRLDA